MTHKEQNKILDAKIESNVNQYKVDRMNAEISAFSSSELNKYEFLKRIDLIYKPIALDKARFEFSPLGKTFSMGLDKTAQGYQEEGTIKLLKDIRDSLGRPPRPNNGDDNDDNNDDDNDDNNDDDNDDNNDDDDDNNDDKNLEHQKVLDYVLKNYINVKSDGEYYVRLIEYQNEIIKKLEKGITDRKNL